VNPTKLKERQIAIKATPLGERNIIYNAGRRQLPKNNIGMDNPIDQSYSNFFEYEQELSGIKPSSELFSMLEENEKKEETENLILNDNTNKNITNIENNIEINNSSIILEEVDHIVTTSFDFIRCEFIKQDGERCKRQAPKNHKFCSKHKNLTLI
jgi:hypothetical protein